MTSTELGYLSGVTSNIQDQLNGKVNKEYVDNSIYDASVRYVYNQGGEGMLGNSVMIGWDGTRMRIQVDSSPFGFVPMGNIPYMNCGDSLPSSGNTYNHVFFLKST